MLLEPRPEVARLAHVNNLVTLVQPVDAARLRDPTVIALVAALRIPLSVVRPFPPGIVPAGPGVELFREPNGQ